MEKNRERLFTVPQNAKVTLSEIIRQCLKQTKCHTFALKAWLHLELIAAKFQGAWKYKCIQKGVKQIYRRMQRGIQPFYHWLPEASRRKSLLDALHFLQSSVSTWVRTLSEKGWAGWCIFGLLQHHCFYEFRNKGSSNILVEEKKKCQCKRLLLYLRVPMVYRLCSLLE